MKQFFALAMAVSILFSCSKTTEPKYPKTPENVIGGRGVVIANEGIFTGGTGTVSFYKPNDQTIANNLFQTVNNIPIGNVLQSVSQEGNHIYFVVNNSDKIVVADANTLVYKAEISGLNQPRYFKSVSATKAYVSNWGTNSISILDLTNNSVTGSIQLGNGPDKMVFDGSFLYVANSGGFGVDSTVMVIDVVNDLVVDTLLTGYNPNSLAIDASNKLWVLCGGISDWNDPTNDVAGKLMQFNLANNNSELKQIDFPNSNDHPAHLTTNSAGDILHYLSNGYFGSVYQMNISENSLPTTATVNGGFYALGVDPASGEIYTADPKDYASAGTVFRYLANGTLIDSVKTGIIPNWFLFKN